MENKTLDNKKPNKRRKINKIILTVDFIIGILIIISIFYTAFLSPLKLKGEKTISHELGKKYVDQGTNHRFAKMKGHVDTSKPGEYIITYKLLNQKVKRKVLVVDGGKIVMGLKGSSNAVVREGDPYIESGAFAIDKEDGPVNDKYIKVSGKVDTSKPGTYKLIYKYDRDGIIKTLTRRVEVIDKNSFEENTDGISVMMYHYVYTEDDPPSKINSNYILSSDLDKQFKYLSDNGYYFPSFKELRAYIDGKISLPKKSVVLTFDDGQEGFFKYGVPIAEKYKIPITSYIIGVQDGARKVKDNASPYVQFQSHSYDMHRAGGNIGHNGRISAMNKSDIISDLKRAITDVGNGESFAYPYGDYTDDAKQAVKEVGIIASFTTEYGKVRKSSDYSILPRVRVSGDNNFNTWKNSL